jgi:acyl-CoA synthetase (NDP forming)
MNMGRIILNNLFNAGFDRSRAYVIRPGCDEIDGARCVPTVADLPEKVDLLVLAVGAAQVPEVIGQIIEHDRANAVILIPGGLGEKAGSEDLARSVEARIREAHTTEGGGPVFVGGNSLGVISHPGSYDTMFIPEAKLPKSRGDHERRSCFVSQSGAFIISNLSRMPWFDPSYALSIGNQTDLTASDYLAFLKDDPTIDVIVVYMEGFQDGDGLELARQVREAVSMGKQVVFYKAGRTSEGRSATAGHTASVAGDYAVCEAALRSAGAHVAGDFNELSDLVRLATRLHGKRFGGRRLLAMSNAGFESVGMADSIVQGRARLDLARPGAPTRERLAEILGEHKLDRLVDVKNPFDITPMASDAAYTQLIGAILEDRAIDLVVVGIVPLTPALQTLPDGVLSTEAISDPASIANTLPELARSQDKPVIAVVDSGVLFDPLVERLEAGGLPVFRSADRAVRVVCRYLDTTLDNQQRLGSQPPASA